MTPADHFLGVAAALGLAFVAARATALRRVRTRGLAGVAARGLFRLRVPFTATVTYRPPVVHERPRLINVSRAAASKSRRLTTSHVAVPAPPLSAERP
jgi:hypothetical protein